MVRDRGRAARGLAAAALLACAVTLLRGASPAQVEAVQTDLAYTSTAIWTVDPPLGRVHIVLMINATSNAPDTGGRRYYYPGLQLTLPSSTDRYVALDDLGQPLPVSILSSTPSGVIVNVRFGQPLYSGQRGWLEFKFDLVDKGGSTDRDLRIGQDVVSFLASAFGSPGTPGSSITVIFPAGLIVQEQFGPLVGSADSSGQTIFSSGVVPDSTAASARFTASRNVPPSDFQVAHVSMGAVDVTLRYWADDPGWADQVQRVLSSGYPLLRQLIGLGDPTASSLTIEEATTGGIGGFSGDYDPGASIARVSYFADPMVILHELAHMWFNGHLSSGRWIDEGFASFYSEQVVLRLGLPDQAPALGPSLMRAAIPLNAWTDAGAPGTATEAYLYGASLEVAREIAAIAGIEGLSRVWVEAAAGTATYPAAATASPTPTVQPAQPAPATGLNGAGAADWRRLLDYLESVTGQSFDEIWQRWVLAPSQSALLDDRNVVLADYAATVVAAGPWSLPPDVREAMSGWEFATARGALAQAREVLSIRRQIDEAAAAESTTRPASLQTAFETVGTAAALAEAQQELAAIDELSAARQAKADNQGAAKAVGLLGTDPDADLAAARKAFAAGDIVRTESLARAARSAWAGAAGVGQVRILGAAASVAGVLLLIAVYIWTRSARRKEDEPPAAEPVAERLDA